MDKVSVVVTTRNEEKHIGSCLASIPKENTEIIVVDNFSYDKTQDIAKEYTDKVYLFGNERSAQRNYGVQRATGKYVLYLDADMILTENVITEAIQSGADALYIPEQIIGIGFWIRVRNFERSFYNATVIDAIRFFRRDLFLRFDETLTGPEDWDFDRRMKFVAVPKIISSPLLHNEGRFNLKKYISKKVNYMKDFDAYKKKWGGDNNPTIRKQLGWYYRMFGVFTENFKWIRLVRHPILAMGMFALRFMVGITYLKKRLT